MGKSKPKYLVISILLLVATALNGCYTLPEPSQNPIKDSASAETVSYCYFEEWQANSGDEIIRGALRVEMHVTSLFDDRIGVSVKTDMPPFSQVVLLEMEAKYEDDRYVFETHDGWSSRVFGYIMLEEDTAVLLTEVEFSEHANKNVGRLYGTEHVLKRGIIDWTYNPWYGLTFLERGHVRQ